MSKSKKDSKPVSESDMIPCPYGCTQKNGKSEEPLMIKVSDLMEHTMTHHRDVLREKELEKRPEWVKILDKEGVPYIVLRLLPVRGTTQVQYEDYNNLGDSLRIIGLLKCYTKFLIEGLTPVRR